MRQQGYDEARKRFDKDGHASAYEVEVSFNDARKKRYTLSYRLSLDLYASVMHLSQHTLHDLAKDFNKFLGKFSGLVESGRLKVAASDDDYKRWAFQWQIDNSGEQIPMARTRTPAGRPSPSKFDALDAKDPLIRPADVGRTRQRAGGNLRRIAQKSKGRPRR
jgi:hypothetical protein